MILIFGNIAVYSSTGTWYVVGVFAYYCCSRTGHWAGVWVVCERNKKKTLGKNNKLRGLWIIAENGVAEKHKQFPADRKNLRGPQRNLYQPTHLN